MEPLSEKLQDKQYYIELLDSLIEENDMEIKHRLQKADTYSRFIGEQAAVLMDKTTDYIRENESSFAIASSIILENWTTRMFS